MRGSWVRVPEGLLHVRHMVIVAQLAEHWIVVPVVAGSIPVNHPACEANRFSTDLIAQKQLIYRTQVL